MEHVVLSSLANLATVPGLSFLLLGVLVGMLFGAIPGLGGTTALAILIPLTFSMTPQDAILLLGGVMGAGSFGGSITAILINTPGTSSNGATCLDGHPLAQQGKAGLAIGAAAAASSLGGIIGVVVLIGLLPFARAIILAFGPPQFFLLTVLGLAAVAMTTSRHFVRGLLMAAFGLTFSFVGYDDVGGNVRFTLGSDYLWDGIGLIPALIGLFAVAEMIKLTIEGGVIAKSADKVSITGVTDGIIAVFKHYRTLLKGSIIGTLVGIMPGIGGTVAGFLSYSFVSQTSKDPESFGTGNIEGVIAPEAANNAKDGGSLIPTLAFGIPGSAETAVFLGALVIHGIQPGPMLLVEHPDIVFNLIVALTISCILASLIGIAAARHLALITKIDATVLVPIVLCIAFVGTYTVKRSFGDVILALIFGIIGYAMLRFEFPRITLIIGLVLGGLAERSYHQALMISRHDYGTFWAGGIAQFLIFLLLLTLLTPAIRRIYTLRKRR